jgi:flavin-dependent dehydrogenase
VERAVLDAALLDAAIAAGAHLEQSAVTDLQFGRDNAVTGVVTREGARNASLVIGADGLRSIVARRLGASGRRGPLRKLSLTYHVNVPDVAPFGEMHVGRDLCAGLATVRSDGRCNLTIVADAARFGRAVARDTREFVHAAIATLPRLRDRVPRADIDRATPLASGPFDQPVQRVAFDGAVLVGDAAGYYDPFTGQGVFQALAAAELLAPSAIEALRSSAVRAAAFRGYVRGRSRMMRGSRLVQHGIETILSRPRLADHAIARIRRAPAFAHAIMDVTGDLAPARALLSRRAIASLLIPTTPENAA